MRTTAMTHDGDFMRRYLLGVVPDQERSEFEERYAGDADLFEELLTAENELVDQHAKGQLTEDERLQFETYYLRTPEGRNAVAFAKCLADYQTEYPQAQDLLPTKKHGGFRAWLSVYAIAGAAAVLASVMAVSLWRSSRI